MKAADNNPAASLVVGANQTFNSSIIREQWISEQLKKQVKDFTEQKPVLVHTVTWNVNGKKPSEDLTSLFSLEQQPDVFVIGFQEIVDLNAATLMVDHNASEAWLAVISKTLDALYPRAGFHLVVLKHMVGISLIVSASKAIAPFITDVDFETAGVGIMGVGGNKGGVAIRFKIYDSTCCVVCTHLAAHQNNVQGRNADYHNVCRKLAFSQRKRVPEKDRDSVPASATYSIFDHNFVIWLGDLNYRVDMHDMTMDEIFRRIENNDLAYLLQRDQLVVEKAAKNAFDVFEELPITFAPTYKYQAGTQLYERRPEKKQRSPAWCDRIQYIPDESLKQLSYYRSELAMSDHKPVCALFELKASRVVLERKKAVVAELAKKLDLWENEQIPKVEVVPPAVCFEAVEYDTAQTRSILIRNTGQAVVKFRFIPKLQEDRFCKPWLNISPEFAIIPPDQSLSVTLTVHVSQRSALDLNSGKDSLDDILILQLERGRDYFITVSGEYHKSCFGSSIQYLVNTPSPVRLAATTKRGPTKALSMPKELWRLVDFIFKNGMDAPLLFVNSGNLAEIEEIRVALDTGSELRRDLEIHSVAETLIRFLDSLYEPIFPASLVNQYTENMGLTLWCKQALMQLNAAHYNCFIYLVSFLREVLKHGERNKLTPLQLVLVFSGCLMHTPPLQSPPGRSKPKPWLILEHFITSDDFI